MTRKTIAVFLVLMPLAFAGCTSVNPSKTFSSLDTTVTERTGQPLHWMRDSAAAKEMQNAVQTLLQRELTVDDAVQIALLNNRSLQATLEEIGIAQADFVQAGLLRNPEFSASVRFPDRPPSAANTEFSLVGNFLDLLMLPLRKRVAAAQLEQTKLKIADEVLHLVAEVKTAYYTAQASQQLVARLRLIAEINDAVATLAKKQHDAGNLNDLDLLHQQSVQAQSKIEVSEAEVSHVADREAFNRLLGLSSAQTQWKIADRLPELPAQEIATEPQQLEAFAIERRWDLQAAWRHVDSVRQALSLRKNTRLLPAGVHIGVDTEHESDQRNVTGPTLELELPLFDQGQADVARLQAQLRQSERQWEALEIQIRSEVRETTARLLASRTLTEFYGKTLLPQRVRAIELTLQQYNFMLKGTYDLLAAKQKEVETERAYIEAWRNYWITRTQLERVLGGKLPASSPVPEGKKESVTPQPENEKSKHEHNH